MKDVFYAVASACLVALTVSTIFLMRSVNADLLSVKTDVHSLVVPAQKAEASIAAASLTVAQIGAKERNSFDAQQKYYTELTARTNTILEDFHNVVIPRVASTLDHTTSAVDAIGNSTSDLARSGGDLTRTASISIEKIDPLMDALTRRVNDPAYDKILANAQTSTANLAAMTDDGHAMTTDIRGFVHRETNPVRGTWNVIKAFLREFAGPAAQVATAVK